MRWAPALLFFSACTGGTGLSRAAGLALQVRADGGVELVLSGADCPRLSGGATAMMNGQPGVVRQRGQRASGCGGGCVDAVVSWPSAAPRMEFSVGDDGRTVTCVIDATAPVLSLALDGPDGGLSHYGLGAPMEVRWEPKLPIERLRVDLRNPALMWRGGRPVVLCGPGKCVLPGADAGAVVMTVPRSAMPGPTALNATALFQPRVERCEGAEACTAALPATAATASGAIIIDADGAPSP